MTTPKKAPPAPPVDAWSGEIEPREHTLPSGKTVTLRRAPSLGRLVREGVIPNAMLGIVMVPVEIELEDGTGTKTLPAYETNMKRFEEQSAAIVCAMVVDPPVTMSPLDGAVLYDLIPEDDVTYIVEWAKGGLEGVARFLERLDGDADGASGDPVRESAE